MTPSREEMLASRKAAGDWADALLRTLDPIIAHMEATPEGSWQTDTVRSKDGSTNCFFGHLFAMGSDDEHGSALWNGFENLWASTYLIYPINDGENSRYPQATPKQRILAYLRDLRDGKAKTAPQLMEEDYEHWLAGQPATAVAEVDA
jgi:hypothetical protein